MQVIKQESSNGTIMHFGTAVTSLGTSTKLLYVSPVSTGMDDCFPTGKLPHYFNKPLMPTQPPTLSGM